MRYIIYSRILPNVQATTNQMKACIGHVCSSLKVGDEIIHFSDDDVSKRIKLNKSEKLVEMMKFLKKGDTLVVYAFDRLSMDYNQIVVIYLSLITDGINIFSIREPHIRNNDIHNYALLKHSERVSRQNRNLKKPQKVV